MGGETLSSRRDNYPDTGDLLLIWKASIKPPRLAPRTFESYVSMAKGILLRHFEGRTLVSIRSIDIEEFLNDRADLGAGSATLNRYLATRSSIFKYAVKKRHAAVNPIRKVSRVREKLPPIRYLSVEDANRLLAARPGWLRPAVLVALDVGLRAGEIGALTRRDIDLSRGVITVRDSKSRQPREVGMTERLRGAMREHLKTLPRGQEVVLLTSKGRSFAPGGYRLAFKRATGRAEIRSFRFHDLRHACGVRLAEAGATPGEISAFLGHKTLAMTMRYIRHAPRDAARSVASLLDQPGRSRRDRGEVDAPADDTTVRPSMYAHRCENSIRSGPGDSLRQPVRQPGAAGAAGGVASGAAPSEISQH